MQSNRSVDKCIIMETVRAELNKLQQQRAALEAEINERSARLNAAGQPGMHDSLIDKEVGPRLPHTIVSWQDAGHPWVQTLLTCKRACTLLTCEPICLLS